jgi:hypothetical protein
MTPQMKSFPVAAGAYRESNPKSFLIHLCEVDANGFPTKVLCSRVKLSSILDDACAGDENPATCTHCLAKASK